MSKHVWAAVNKKVWWANKSIGFGSCATGIDVWIPRSQCRCLEYDVGGDSKEIRCGELVRSICIPAWLAANRNLKVIEECESE